jgi:hypothetical protein
VCWCEQLPDAYYEQQEKIIELVEGFNQASTGAGVGDDDEGAMAARQQTGGRGPRQAYDDDDSDEDGGRYGDDEDDEEDQDGGDQHGEGDDVDRFADADEDDDDDLPPLEEDERKKGTRSHLQCIIAQPRWRHHVTFCVPKPLLIVVASSQLPHRRPPRLRT